MVVFVPLVGPGMEGTAVGAAVGKPEEERRVI